MIELHHQRLWTGHGSTIGTLQDAGGWWGFIIEDAPTPDPYGIKVPGKTRIPAGRYQLGLAKSPMAQRNQDAHPDWHTHGMIWIRDVPGFSHIRVHPGRSHRSTAGCPCIGARADVDGTDEATIGRSLEAYRRFYVEHAPRLAKGETGWWTVADELPLPSLP